MPPASADTLLACPQAVTGAYRLCSPLNGGRLALASA